jgi:hypothetical protein
MNEFIFFMHDDVLDRGIARDEQLWEQYLAKLRASGQFDGGSAIGQGMAFKKGRADAAAAAGVSGFLRVRAEDMEAAKRFLVGNPNYEAGGTVEVRELPRS